MFSSPNMGLIIWDQETDPYEHSNLVNDWTIIDGHDHSEGKGVQINTPGIAAGAITTPLIANGAVGTNQLADNSVSTAKLQDNSVTGAKIASGAIGADDIAAGAIGFPQLDPAVIPLGFVSTWYRAAGMTNVPGGNWEIMDGRPWSSISNKMGSGGSALNTGNIPDMRNRFAMGASTSPTGSFVGIGTQGGSNTVNLTHGHIVDAHFHTIGPHVHPIALDGRHSHTFMGGLGIWSRTNAFNIGFATAYYPYSSVSEGTAGIWANTFYTMYIKNLGSVPGFSNEHGNINPTWDDGATPMDEVFDHNHGGQTGGNNSFTTGTSGAFTDTALGSVNVQPSYTGLLYIMRVR